MHSWIWRPERQSHKQHLRRSTIQIQPHWKQTSPVCFQSSQICKLLILCSANDEDIEGGADIPWGASKPKPRAWAVLKKKATEEDSEADGEETGDVDPFGMSYAK